MMVKVLVCAYATGCFSSRKIAPRRHKDIAFQVLAADKFSAHRTIRDFRANHLVEFPQQLPQDLFCAVDLHVGVPHVLDLRRQYLVALSLGTASARFALECGMPPISRRGDLQGLADRLDPDGLAVPIDERPQDFNRWSNSARVKKRSPASGSRWLGAVPSPRAPVLSCVHAFMRACGGASPGVCIDFVALDPFVWRLWQQQILGAMDSMAAHSEGYASRCSCTTRTARSRTSGESLLDFFRAQSSQRFEPPQKPGRFTTQAG